MPRKGKHDRHYDDAVTGEVIQVEDPNQVAERKLTEVGAIDSNTFNFLNDYREMCERYDIFRNSLKTAMEENFIKKWETNEVSFSVTPEGTRQAFDTDRAKNMKLSDFLSILINMDKADLERISVYDYFQKLSYTKSKLNVRFK